MARDGERLHRIQFITHERSFEEFKPVLDQILKTFVVGVK
jgi:hypothetical protein